ncbi:hypothetical protein CcI156_00895 [Frankia sp. CcI156]|nr:hypothetical protein CcI156_00895 [Frankia sp. CcI156]ORT51481.1 hypothetical protein KBI5_11870 [Frankia sp. KB5]
MFQPFQSFRFQPSVACQWLTLRTGTRSSAQALEAAGPTVTQTADTADREATTAFLFRDLVMILPSSKISIDYLRWED